jgi:hypothetical protein
VQARAQPMEHAPCEGAAHARTHVVRAGIAQEVAAGDKIKCLEARHTRDGRRLPRRQHEVVRARVGYLLRRGLDEGYTGSEGGAQRVPVWLDLSGCLKACLEAYFHCRLRGPK